jgi:hypothetical protein
VTISFSKNSLYRGISKKGGRKEREMRKKRKLDRKEEGKKKRK